MTTLCTFSSCLQGLQQNQLHHNASPNSQHLYMVQISRWIMPKSHRTIADVAESDCAHA